MTGRKPQDQVADLADQPAGDADDPAPEGGDDGFAAGDPVAVQDVLVRGRAVSWCSQAAMLAAIGARTSIPC